VLRVNTEGDLDGGGIFEPVPIASPVQIGDGRGDRKD